jgi:aspartate racemase
MTYGNKLTVGILGGMGPAATLDLFKKIIEATPAQRDEEHLNIQIDCNPVPGADRQSLCVRAVRLEQLGVDMIAIPCNAAHVHFEAIRAAVHIPVANMIYEAVDSISRQRGSILKVGIMAWREVLAFGLYQSELEKAGFSPLVPQKEEIAAISAFIQAIKAGRITESGRQSAIEVGNALFTRGADAIILGCTDLPLAISQHDFVRPIVDATQTLASAVVNIATGSSNIGA